MVVDEALVEHPQVHSLWRDVVAGCFEGKQDGVERLFELVFPVLLQPDARVQE